MPVPDWRMNDNLLRAEVLRRSAQCASFLFDSERSATLPEGFTMQGCLRAGAEALEALVDEPGGTWTYNGFGYDWNLKVVGYVAGMAKAGWP